DYRKLYRTYRSDAYFQKALENHTWIITRDDHETANDCYWDYARHTLGAPDHPYTVDPQYGNDPVRLNSLMLDSQRAWLEYVPARVKVNLDSTDPQQFLKHYRSFDLGGMVDLFMLDTRTYRTAHPCGEGAVGQRYLPLKCAPETLNASTQFLMGETQREWLINGLTASTAKWRLIGNQTYMGKLGFKLSKYGNTPVDVDAWDGYSYERNLLSQEFKSNGVNNLVVATGDLHTFIASRLKVDYSNKNPNDQANMLGVEFMTPSVTSAGLLDMLSGGKASKKPLKPVEKAALIEFMSTVVRTANPHIRFFNTIDHGYSTLEFTAGYCEWSAYIVDKDVNSSASGKKLTRRYRTYAGDTNIVPA
ncbi:MAG TPA: alkaline phosphatase D family protein, partial [Pseudomonadales bacterium]|nr:alkaline phosphatase D family protein [Pseudomonadales bacterium]